MKTGGESVVHRRDKGVAKEAKEVKVVAGFAGVGDMGGEDSVPSNEVMVCVGRCIEHFMGGGDVVAFGVHGGELPLRCCSSW